MLKRLFVVAFGLSLCLTFAGLDYWNDPLRLLERETRAVTVHGDGYRFERANDQFWNAIQVGSIINQDLGGRIAFQWLGPGMAGDTDPITRKVRINSALSWNERLATLAHEGAHLLEPNNLDHADSEVFAEAVAYLVCRSFGLDRVEDHARYLAGHKSGLHVLIDYRREIERAARILEGR